MGFDDEPLDPNATDQLAAALGPSALGEFPAVPEHWFGADQAPPMDAGQVPVDAGAAAPPIAPGDQGPLPGPPPIDGALAGFPPPGAGVLPPGGLAPMPPPAPSVDAVSGAGGTPAAGSLEGTPFAAALTPQQQYQQTAQDYQTHPEQLLAKLTAGGPLDDATQHYLNDLARRDPGGFAEVQTRVADAKLKHLAAEQHRIADHDYEVQQQNFAIRNKAIEDARHRTAALDARAQELASTKIGQLSIGQRVAGVVAAFVGGLYQGKTGSAHNPGLDAFNGAIDRQVEAQKAELSNKREALGLQRSAIGEEYARSGDAYQAAETMRMAALKHADNLLATQQQDYAADGTRGIQIATLRAGIAGQQQKVLQDFHQKGFDNSIKLQNAAREQQLADETRRHNRNEEGLAYGTQSLARQKFGYEQQKDAAELGLKREELGAKRQERADVRGDKVATETIYNPTSGSALIQPEGQKLLAQADAIEKAARTLPPDQQDVLRQHAAEMRQKATTEAGWRVPDSAQNGKIKESIGRAQNLVDLATKIQRVLDADPSSVDRDAWAGLTADFEQAKANYIKAIGANASSREFQAVEPMFGASPEHVTARVASRGKMKAALGSLIEGAVRDTTSSLRSHGYRGTWQPAPPPDEAFPRLADPTLAEQVQSAEPGILAQGERAMFQPLGFERAGIWDPEGRVEEGAQVGPTGLSQRDTATVAGLTKRFASANDDDRGKIVAQASAYANSPRESVSNGVLRLLRGDSPELYRAVVATLPPERLEAIHREEQGLEVLSHGLPPLPGGLPSFPPQGGR